MDLYDAETGISPTTDRTLRAEKEIHGFLERRDGITLGGIDVFIVGSETSVRTGVLADIIGLTEQGHPVIIELKQSQSGRKGSRTALGQALEYGADLRSWSYEQFDELYQDLRDSEQSLREAHAEYFDPEEPLRQVAVTMAAEPRIVLLAENFFTSDLDAARFLRDVNDVDITCIEVTPLEMDGRDIYGFERRLESKSAPSDPVQITHEQARPWLTRRVTEAYHDRFGEQFGLDTPSDAREREGFRKTVHLRSAETHPDDLLYTYKIKGFYDGTPEIAYGVSPDGNRRIEEIIDEHRGEIIEAHDFADRDWRRVRGSANLEQALTDADIATVSPEISQTVSELMWSHPAFEKALERFFGMVERWHAIIDSELTDTS